MRAKIIIKPTAHKAKCLLCEKEILKGERHIWIQQSTYPGYRVGHICKRHLKSNEIEHDFKCSICGKITYLHQDERDMDRGITYPMSEKWEAKHGGVNVAIRLDCGHYMLDDKDDKCPDFVEKLE